MQSTTTESEYPKKGTPFKQGTADSAPPSAPTEDPIFPYALYGLCISLLPAISLWHDSWAMWPFFGMLGAMLAYVFSFVVAGLMAVLRAKAATRGWLKTSYREAVLCLTPFYACISIIFWFPKSTYIGPATPWIGAGLSIALIGWILKRGYGSWLKFCASFVAFLVLLGILCLTIAFWMIAIFAH